MAFKQNFSNKFEIDTTGGLDPAVITSATFKVLAKGISTITPAVNDTTDNTAYYDGEGFSSTDVNGKNVTIAFAGNREYGDEGQDYVAGLEYKVGEDVKTLLKWTRPDGTVVIAQVTITNIITSGGGATAKQTFSFTANFNGKPVVTTPAP